jgi:hypothetical protein
MKGAELVVRIQGERLSHVLKVSTKVIAISLFAAKVAVLLQ